MPLSHSGWSAWISVDGEELPQYSVKIVGQPGSPPEIPKFHTVSCWLPSQEGKEFVVNIDYASSPIKPESWFAMRTELDGNRLSKSLYCPGDRFPRAIKGCVVDTKTERPLVFATLNLNDDEYSLDPANVDALGTISISLRRVIPLSKDGIGFCRVAKGLTSPMSIHEANKKAGSHRILLGERRELQKPARPHSKWRTSSPDKAPFLKFIFHYRSADILRAQEIIPQGPTIAQSIPTNSHLRTPSKGNKSNPIDIKEEDIESDAEMEEIRALEQKLNALKKRRKEKDSRDTSFKRPKTEEDRKPVITVKTEIIDLT
ncbi:hypothetical protein M422DRAFT_26873, partial [Sphaerobolus stellatus SS14]